MVRVLFYLTYMPLSMILLKLLLEALSSNANILLWFLGFPICAAIQLFELHIFRIIKRKFQYLIIIVPLIMASIAIIQSKL